MAGPGTLFTGPVLSGTQKYPSATAPANIGNSVIMQTALMVQNGSNNVEVILNLPAYASLVGIVVQTSVVWNSGTSATLSAGITSGGTDYMSGVSVKTGGLTLYAATTAQCINYASIGTNTALYVDVTVVGTAATTGATLVTILYVQNVELNVGAT